MEEERKKAYAVPVAIVVAGLVIAGAVFVTSKNNDKENKVAVKTRVENAEITRAGISEDDDPVLGNPDASVVFINFGDFRCRFCAMFQRDIKPVIIEKYVKTGKVKYVYRDLITMGENSILAAEGANCAGEQGKYWDFADYLHAGQGGHNVLYTPQSLSEIAASLGLDVSLFDECLSSGRQKEEIKKDTEDAIAAGADGTPTVFINGRIIVGVNPIEVYESMIEEELQASKKYEF
jgi:protein-disulfide isomerase